jgi:hypothetical protein
MNYSQHPLSAAFPAMGSETFLALVEDVRSHGQRDTATLYDGMVIDGWHRYKACQELSIPCRFEEFSGLDAVAFVRSKNQHRRHYQKSQQAAIEVSLTAWAEAHRPRKGEAASPFSTKGEAASPFSTNKEMADRAGTTERTIQHAKRAHEAGLGEAVRDGKVSAERAAELAKADPALAKQVAHGEVSLSAAVAKVEGKPAKQKPEASAPAEPAEEAPPVYTALDEAMDTVRELQNALALANAGDLSDEDKTQAADLIARLREENRILTLKLRAVTASRDQYQNENGELKRQITRQRREIDKLAGTHTA